MPKSSVSKPDKKRWVRVPEEASRNLPVPAGEKRYQIDKATKKKLKTMFGQRTREILTLIENNERDGAVVLIYKQLLKMLVSLVPILEKVVRRSKGRYGTYQVNQLVSQLRELLADMQSVQDRGLLGRTLIKRYVRPAFADIAMQMLQNDQRILNLALLHLPGDRRAQVEAELKETQKELARFIQAQYRHVSEEIIKGLT